MSQRTRLAAIALRALCGSALLAGCDAFPPAAMPSASNPATAATDNPTVSTTQPADSTPTVPNDEPQSTDTTGDAVGIAQVDPPSAGPGQIIRITTLAAFDVSVPDGGTILIGGLAATIVSADMPAEFNVMVPILDPRAVSVQLARDGKPLGEAAELEILPPIAQRLLLTYEKGNISILDARPSAGGFHEGGQEDDFRLAYDVCNPEGGLVYSGAILHPQHGRHEIFDLHENGTRTLRRVSGGASAVFVLKIPNLPLGGAVKFYEVEAGVDLGTRAGRAARRFLNEIQISR